MAAIRMFPPGLRLGTDNLRFSVLGFPSSVVLNPDKPRSLVALGIFWVSPPCRWVCGSQWSDRLAMHPPTPSAWGSK